MTVRHTEALIWKNDRAGWHIPLHWRWAQDSGALVTRAMERNTSSTTLKILVPVWHSTKSKNIWQNYRYNNATIPCPKYHSTTLKKQPKSSFLNNGNAWHNPQIMLMISCPSLCDQRPFGRWFQRRKTLLNRWWAVCHIDWFPWSLVLCCVWGLVCVQQMIEVWDKYCTLSHLFSSHNGTFQPHYSPSRISFFFKWFRRQESTPMYR